MNLVYFDAHEKDTAALKAALPDCTVTTVLGPLTEATVAQAQAAECISVFVDSHVTPAFLDQMPQLKLIAARSAGVDHIDLAACRQRNIIVAHVPHYGETTVAEHTFALILSLSRKIFQSYERTEKMNFDRTGLEGFDLRGKTLGVVGTGNIGRRCIEIAGGFGMKVVAYDVAPDAALAEKLQFSYADEFPTLLEQSDIVTLHVPYIPSTHHLINRDTIAITKRGALLINTARGALVDAQALLWALETGIVSGAGLDVLEEEHDAFDRVEFMSRPEHTNEGLATLLRNHLLAARDDVIITPHNAFNSREAVQKIFATTVSNIQSFLDNKPQNVVS